MEQMPTGITVRWIQRYDTRSQFENKPCHSEFEFLDTDGNVTERKVGRCRVVPEHNYEKP